jgi:hypothetical protein
MSCGVLHAAHAGDCRRRVVSCDAPDPQQQASRLGGRALAAGAPRQAPAGRATLLLLLVCATAKAARLRVLGCSAAKAEPSVSWDGAWGSKCSAHVPAALLAEPLGSAAYLGGVVFLPSEGP